jgi:hypothetical protein
LRNRRVLIPIALAVVVLALAGGVIAFFVAGSTSGSYGAAKAGALPAGNTPDAPSVLSRNVTVSWAQNSPAFLGGLLGADANGGYLVNRYAENDLISPITPGATCNGLRQGAAASLFCTETGLPTGRWKYTATPAYYLWRGTESGQSASVIVAPANPTSVLLVNGGGAGSAFINSANKSSLNFDVALPPTSLASDTITLTLTDPGVAHTISATMAGSAGAGTVSFAGVNGSALNDGTITITAKATSSYGDASAGTASLARTKDTVVPANSLSLNSQSPAGSSLLSGSTVYYRGTGGGAGGSFAIRNAVTDGASGPASSTTSALGGTTTGWVHAPSTVSAPSGGPYVSNAFTWSELTSSSPTEVVTGADLAGNTTAAPTLTFTADSVGPTGGSVSYTNGYLTTTSVTVTFTAGSDAGSGLSASSRQLQRASATLLNGSCGAFGSFATVATNPTSPYADATVSSGNCYQYQYVVSDNVGNPTAFTSASIARIDTGKPTNAMSLAISPAPAGAFLNGTTLYYKSDAAGSFKLVNAVTDGLSGPASASFPAVGASGWTHVPDTVSSGTGSAPTISYTSSLYSWTANPNAVNTPDRRFTSADVAGNVSLDTMLTFTEDTSAPTGGALSVNGTGATGGAGSSSFNKTGGFAIGTRTDYNADTGSGLASSVLTVEVGTLSGNACSAYGAPSTIAGNPSQSGLSDGCYRYTLTGKDNVGNTSTVTTTVKVDTVAPSTTDNTASIGNAWRNTNATVTLTPSDTGSGVATTYYTTDGSTPTTSSSTGTSIVLSATGLYTIKYFSVDNAGNSEVIKTAGTQIRIDKVAPTDSVSLNSASGAFLNTSTNTIYFNKNTGGSFKLSDAVTDSNSGPASATFPGISVTGWTVHTGSEIVSSGSGSAPTITYTTSTAYTFGITAINTSGTVTGKDVATNTSSGVALTLTADTTPPATGSVTVPAYVSAASIPVTFSAGTDGGSGINTASGQLSRATGTYTAGADTCSAFGSFTNIGSAGVTSPFTDTAVSANTCYQYKYTVSDNVGNPVTYTSGSVAYDTTTPTVSSVQLKNNTTAGKIEKGDQIIITFSEQMSVASMCSTWSGDGTDQTLAGNSDVIVNVNDVAGSDTIAVTSGTCTFNFGSISLGSTAYNTSGSTIAFSGSGPNKSTIAWTASTHTLTITLGGGTTTPSTAVASSIATYSPNATVTDSAGNGSMAAKATANVQQF